MKLSEAREVLQDSIAGSKKINEAIQTVLEATEELAKEEPTHFEFDTSDLTISFSLWPKGLVELQATGPVDFVKLVQCVIDRHNQ